MRHKMFQTMASALCLVAAAPGLTEPGSLQPEIASGAVPTLTLGGLRFRDSDRDGKLSPFEDWRLSPDVRARDLVSRMTLEEKAGTMMHSSLAGIGSPIGFSPEGYDLSAVEKEIDGKKITSFITRLPVSPLRMAEENNKIQEIAERTRLAIPLTISSDPRNHFYEMPGAASAAGGYSQWPETLGFAALRDPNIVHEFGDFVRQEYRATGIHEALSPQADLYTEPRWSRGFGTFGSNAALTRKLVKAYVAGFQGSDTGLAPTGVITIVKHWVGYGASPEGLDGHNYYGRIARLDDKSLKLHIEPFKGAFEAGVAGVMPTYDIVEGVTVGGRALEPVAAGYNKQLLTDLLRGTYRYRGVILSDWLITENCTDACIDPKSPQQIPDLAMPWGVEKLSKPEKFAKAIDAGIDQFGGVSDTQAIVDLVRAGTVTEARIDQSVERILITKFKQGLFENPFVDTGAVKAKVDRAEVHALALRTQAEAQVLVKNSQSALPLKTGARVWLHNVNADKARAAGLIVVERPEDADFALVRSSTPFEQLHPNHFFGSMQKEGRLDYRPGNPDFDLVANLHGKTRVVLAAYTDRAAVMTQIAPLADAILINFGVSDEALLNVVTGRDKAKGKLPFEMPSSMEAVERQNPALPDDSASPLFPYGSGLIN